MKGWFNGTAFRSNPPQAVIGEGLPMQHPMRPDAAGFFAQGRWRSTCIWAIRGCPQSTAPCGGHGLHIPHKRTHAGSRS